MSQIHPALASVTGQSRALAFLTDALRAGRLPHGLLFSGPTGVGRFTTAEKLAGIFLAADASDPAEIEKATRHVVARTHPDFHHVTKELIREVQGKSANKAIEFSVDVVREFVVAPASRKSVTGVGKVFVIEEAETMTVGAQNALLKTLEEPAGRTLIVLLTDQPGSLLATIRSRTQLVSFSTLPVNDAAAIATRHGVEPALAELAARVARGSPGLAIRYARDGVALSSKTWFGLLDSRDPRRADLMAEFLKSQADAYAEKQLERDPRGSKDGFTRAGVAVYLTLAAEHVRHSIASSADPESVCAKIDAIRRAEAYLDGNVNLALAIQQVAGAL